MRDRRIVKTILYGYILCYGLFGLCSFPIFRERSMTLQSEKYTGNQNDKKIENDEISSKYYIKILQIPKIYIDHIHV